MIKLLVVLFYVYCTCGQLQTRVCPLLFAPIVYPQKEWHSSRLTILNKVLNAKLFFPTHFSWAELKDLRLILWTEKANFSQILFTNMSKSVLLSTSSFVEIIYPPHRCGISRCWLNSMIIAQVCLRLATIKGHSKMCSFITKHNDTRFEGACNWHADCRNVHQNCCLWIECSFLYHKPSPKVFQRIWQYI